jgi:hypothetical protein
MELPCFLVGLRIDKCFHVALLQEKELALNTLKLYGKIGYGSVNEYSPKRLKFFSWKLKSERGPGWNP